MNIGLQVLVAYAVIMLLATMLLSKREKDVEKFCVGNRNVGWGISSLSIAATWIWAPALFISTEKAYINGIVGLFWFLVPNIVCLIVFIPFAKKIREEMPEGITLSGYMESKYDSKGVRNIYLFQLTALSVLSTAVQLLAGSKILSMITGMSFFTMTVILAVIAFSYSQFSGIRASIITDAIQMLLMLAISVSFIAFDMKDGMGVNNLINGLSGISGEFGNLFSQKGMEVFLSFGLPATIGLISGPFGDQCFWQRAFCIRKDKIGIAFFVGAILFAIVPLCMGILGFIGAGSGYVVNDVSIINMELIILLFPEWAMIPFLFMIVSGLISTIDSNLCAVSSLATDIRNKKSISFSKSVMIVLLVLGIAIANIPELTITHLFLMYGTLRAATLLPTVFTLKNIKMSSEGIVSGIVLALLIGLPIFAYGNIYNIAIYKTIGSLITVLLSGIIAVIISKIKKRGISKHEKWRIGT